MIPWESLYNLGPDGLFDRLQAEEVDTDVLTVANIRPTTGSAGQVLIHQGVNQNAQWSPLSLPAFGIQYQFTLAPLTTTDTFQALAVVPAIANTYARMSQAASVQVQLQMMMQSNSDTAYELQLRYTGGAVWQEYLEEVRTPGGGGGGGGGYTVPVCRSYIFTNIWSLNNSGLTLNIRHVKNQANNDVALQVESVTMFIV